MLDISECSGEFKISDLKAFMSIFLSLLCLRYIFEGLGRENAIVHSTALWSDGRSDTMDKFDISSSCRSMSRSRVWPLLWVGPLTCCVRPIYSNNSLKVAAQLSLDDSI